MEGQERTTPRPVHMSAQPLMPFLDTGDFIQFALRLCTWAGLSTRMIDFTAMGLMAEEHSALRSTELREHLLRLVQDLSITANSS